jgi:hypothetical protein
MTMPLVKYRSTEKIVAAEKDSFFKAMKRGGPKEVAITGGNKGLGGANTGHQ